MQDPKHCLQNNLYRMRKSWLKSPLLWRIQLQWLHQGVQHVQNYRLQNKNTQEKSALRMHAKEQHGDKKVDYKMEILQTFKKPLARQVMESIYIIQSKSDNHFPMNTKKEFNQALS